MEFPTAFTDVLVALARSSFFAHTLKGLRERLRLINPHWLVNQKKDDSTCGTKPSPTATRERQPCFIPFFHTFLRLLTRGGTPQASGSYALYQGLIASLNIPVAEARDFHCYSHIFENLGNWTIPSDHAAVRLVIQKPTNREQYGKRIPSWMSKHLVFALF